MKCPRCRTTDLKPTMIEEHLPAVGCGTCHGSLVSLVYYRHWAETQKPPESGTPLATPDAVQTTDTTMAITCPKCGRLFATPDAVQTTDTTMAITCPKCGRLMTKHKLKGSVANRVDVCASCDEAWLDRGEWELLEALQLSHQMPSIFTDQWQRRIRREMSEDMRRSILKRSVGDEAVSKVESFREWLRETGHKSEILAYLYRD